MVDASLSGEEPKEACFCHLKADFDSAALPRPPLHLRSSLRLIHRTTLERRNEEKRPRGAGGWKEVTVTARMNRRAHRLLQSTGPDVLHEGSLFPARFSPCSRCPFLARSVSAVPCSTLFPLLFLLFTSLRLRDARRRSIWTDTTMGTRWTGRESRRRRDEAGPSRRPGPAPRPTELLSHHSRTHSTIKPKLVQVSSHLDLLTSFLLLSLSNTCRPSTTTPSRHGCILTTHRYSRGTGLKVGRAG